MSKWSSFEEGCLEYLVNEYQTERVKFYAAGKSDSSAPDIKVHIDNNHEFNIEVKMSSAQSGQFVLIPDDNKKEFNFSAKNKYPENEYSKEIKEYMNQNFDEFKIAGSAGKRIEIKNEVFYNWIKKYYKDDNVEFFISAYKNHPIIVPIDNLEKYFSVTATYRMKKSGSSSPSSANKKEIEKLLKCKGIRSKVYNEGKNVMLISEEDLSGLILEGEAYRYLIRKTKDNMYIIRRLSNTQNSNVIFSIQAYSSQDKNDLNIFILRLKK